MANASLFEAAELGEPRYPRSCVTADEVYRPLFDDEQYNLFIRAAEELPQWVEHLTREEFLEAVPGSDTECIGGELHKMYCKLLHLLTDHSDVKISGMYAVWNTLFAW